VLRPAGGAATGPAADPAAGGQAAAGERAAGGQQDTLPVLPDPVARDAERALARFGLLGEGAAPVFTPGARYPLAGLLLALPALNGKAGCTYSGTDLTLRYEVKAPSRPCMIFCPMSRVLSPRSARGGRARRSSRATLGGASQDGTSAPESTSAPTSQAVSSPCSAPGSISASGRHTSERGSYAHSR
jgi:hypothetical protein